MCVPWHGGWRTPLKVQAGVGEGCISLGSLGSFGGARYSAVMELQGAYSSL